MASRPFRPGAAWRDGKFYRFTGEGVTVMRLWPDPRAWCRFTHTDGWLGCRPPLRLDNIASRARYLRRELTRLERRAPRQLPLFEPYGPLRRLTLAYENANAAVPPATSALARQFRNGQWHMLSILARCEGAEELATVNPAAAFALAHADAFRHVHPDHRYRALRPRLRQPVRQQLQWLGFPSPRSSARVLARIPAAACSAAHLLGLRDALLGGPMKRWLQHLPALSADVLQIAAHPPVAAGVTYGFLEAMCRRRDALPRLGWRVVDAVESAPVLLGEPAGRLRSVDDLWALEQRLFDARAQRIDCRFAGVQFPDPPLPAITDCLEPITSLPALKMEARVQRNCIDSAGYVEAVAQGRAYVYRVLAPARATALVERRNGKWAVSQVRASCNQQPPAPVLRLLSQWLGGDPDAGVFATLEDPDIPF